jgi:hypothetical protein
MDLATIDIVIGSITIISSVTGVAFYIGGLKSIIDRNARRATRLEEKNTQLETDIKEIHKTLIFLGSSGQTTQIRINSIEQFLESKLDFDPVSVHSDITLNDRRQR